MEDAQLGGRCVIPSMDDIQRGRWIFCIAHYVLGDRKASEQGKEVVIGDGDEWAVLKQGY